MKTRILCCALLSALSLPFIAQPQTLPLTVIGRTGSSGPVNNREASGITAYSADGTGRYLFICDDESNIIFRYDRATLSGGSQAPGYTYTIPLSAVLSGGQMDLEGSTLIPNIMTTTVAGTAVRRSYILWSGSCSMNNDPARRGEREQLILTEIVDGATPTLVDPTGSTAVRGRYPSGAVTLTLRDDLAAWDGNNVHGFGAGYFGLGVASTVLNVEGIDYDPTTRRAFLGFRAPLVGFNQRYALIVPILNILDIFGIGRVTTGATQTPVFGTPILVDLHGRGIRDMCKGHLIGGPSGGGPGPQPTEAASPDNFRLFRLEGLDRAYGVTKATQLSPNVYASGENFFHAEALACNWVGSGITGGPILIACDEGDIVGSVNSRLLAYRSTFFDFSTYNFLPINFFDYLSMQDPFGANPVVKFHATTRSGVQQNIEVSIDGGNTWTPGPTGVPWQASYPPNVMALEYSVPVSSANRLTVIRGSVIDGNGTVRLQNAVAVQSDSSGSGNRSALRDAIVHCPPTGEASSFLTFYQDGNFRPGRFVGFQSANPSMASMAGATQGDLYGWGNDDGDPLFTIGTIDSGITTAQLQSTTGSASAPGFCGALFLPVAGDVRLSRRLGALGLPASAGRVGDILSIYGDANGDSGGFARYEYSGTQWIRTYPAPDTAVAQMTLLSPDSGATYVRSGRDSVTRMGFSSFWGE